MSYIDTLMEFLKPIPYRWAELDEDYSVSWVRTCFTLLDALETGEL